MKNATDMTDAEARAAFPVRKNARDMSPEEWQGALKQLELNGERLMREQRNALVFAEIERRYPTPAKSA